ncbi:MAG: hypothetical protein J6J36_01545 [Clostridia bacterium]|nr:hypothetical protein [Clostridia bacterium]
MATKKEYINLIRWSCIIASFTDYYFFRIIVLYLLSQSVTPWVAVSIPIVLEFAKLISRGFGFIAKFSLKVDYKKYHVFYLIAFLVLGIIISQCRSIYTIYIFTTISGILSGIKEQIVTRLSTSNKDYESYCFIEEERAQVMGGTLGLIVSQFIFDYSHKLYILGYVVLIIVGTVLNLFLKNIKECDVMIPINEEVKLNKKDRNNTIIVALLYGIIAGLWCMGWGGFNELSPLISNKVGYLEAIYSTIEVLLLFIISGSVLKKIKEKRKLLFTETIIAIIDVSCLLISALTLSWKGLMVAYVITGFTATMGEPIWGCIISSYSTNSRKKYVLVNKVYCIVRAIATIATWFVCRACVINGVESFRTLAIVLIIAIIFVYIIANLTNKKVFGRSI